MINKTRLIRLTQKLIAINSENPPGNEKDIARFIASEMRACGLNVRTVEFKKNRPNVLAVLKGAGSRRQAGQNALILSPHIDTVPAGRGWKHPPFGAVVVKGKIFGRGASDDKGNLACALEVVRSLAEDKVKLKNDVVLAATADEETGSAYGIVPLLKRNILLGRYALILDSDEFDTIIVQKGLIHGRVKIFGKKAHGAYNWRGVNAIEIASKVIRRLKGARFSFKRHALLRGPTVNIGTIQGGDKVNMVADFCEFSFDLRFLPGMSPAALIRKIKSLVAKDAKKFSVEIDNVQAPYEISAGHPMVRIYQQAARKFRKEAAVKGSEGATVITFFREKGIPAMATGWGAHHTAHSTDEYAKVDDLYQGARVLEQFIKDFDRR